MGIPLSMASEYPEGSPSQVQAYTGYNCHRQRNAHRASPAALRASENRHHHAPVSYTHLDVYKRQGLYSQMEYIQSQQASLSERVDDIESDISSIRSDISDLESRLGSSDQ